jgi:uncharacterized protein (UPF0147 family)
MLTNKNGSNFDLNIANYKIEELEQILELPTNYDESTIEMKETQLRQNILNDKTVPHNIKTNTLNFITDVKKKLTINVQAQRNTTQASNISSLSKTYQNVYNLDKTLQPSDTISGGSTFIIKQPPTAYGQSSPSEFYQGVINPLNKRILRQNINIDTRFRENYYTTQSTNFHLDLPIRLTQVVSLQLSAFEMPTTFYSVSSAFGNNFFVLEISNPGVDPLIVIIPDGNYDYLSFTDYINNFLQNQTVNILYKDIGFIIDANTPVGAGSGGTGRMIVGVASGSTITSFSINFQTDRYGNEDRQQPLPLKCGWIMGFREGFYVNNVSYISEGLIDLFGIKYIYLVIDDFNKSVNDGFYAAFTSSILNKNILARICLQGSVFNLLSQNNFNLITTPRQYFGPVDIQKLQIQLLDEYGRILNLNNMDYSFCLTFQTVYDL